MKKTIAVDFFKRRLKIEKIKRESVFFNIFGWQKKFVEIIKINREFDRVFQCFIKINRGFLKINRESVRVSAAQNKINRETSGRTDKNQVV